MTFEHLQQRWQTHDHSKSVTLEVDALLAEVRRNHRTLSAAVIQRDLVEAGLGLLMAIFWILLATFRDQWTLVVPAAACMTVTIFLLIDRWMQRSWRRNPSDTLVGCLNNSLREVDHQIWILQNSWWWYFLPLAIGAFVFFITMPIVQDAPTWTRPVGVSLALIVSAIVFGMVYRNNNRAVTKSLTPRRSELARLLTNLNQST